MSIKELDPHIDRLPFRPFHIRLTNGAVYDINSTRDIGISKNGSTIFYFGDQGWVLIDPMTVAEVMENVY